jgi:hypothetical protein
VVQVLFSGKKPFMKAIILFTQGLLAMEALAALTGFATWQKWKGSFFKWFPIYLLLIVCLEVMHQVFAYHKLFGASVFMYDITIPIEILFISCFFSQLLNKRSRKITVLGAISFALAFTAEKFLMQQQGYFFQSLSYTVGNLFILAYLILYFIELTRGSQLLQFKKLSSFWFASGMLIFYLGTFPFYGLYNELAKDIGFFIKIAWVATFLNYCMYLFFIIGFIWGKQDL